MGMIRCSVLLYVVNALEFVLDSVQTLTPTQQTDTALPLCRIAEYLRRRSADE